MIPYQCHKSIVIKSSPVGVALSGMTEHFYCYLYSAHIPAHHMTQEQCVLLLLLLLLPLLHGIVKHCSSSSPRPEYRLSYILFLISPQVYYVNPSNAEATFIQSTRMQRFMKTIYSLSCWYSLESSR